MSSPQLADRINRLPYEQLLCPARTAELIGVEPDEAERLLRAGRRSGMITVRREADSLLFMRVRRRPVTVTRRESPAE